MPKSNQWTVFLQNNKGSGKTINELSILYRRDNPRPVTECNALKKVACSSTQNCTWVQSETKKKKSRGKRASFCRGQRTNITQRCTICGNVKQISDWRRHGCDKCLAIPENLHNELGTAAQYKVYRDNLKTRQWYTDTEALGDL